MGTRGRPAEIPQMDEWLEDLSTRGKLLYRPAASFSCKAEAGHAGVVTRQSSRTPPLPQPATHAHSSTYTTATHGASRIRITVRHQSGALERVTSRRLGYRVTSVRSGPDVCEFARRDRGSTDVTSGGAGARGGHSGTMAACYLIYPRRHAATIRRRSPRPRHELNAALNMSNTSMRSE